MDYSSLQASVKTRTPHLWSLYSQSSFKFTIDTFQGSISAAEQLPIIESYSFLPFNGPIRLRSPEQEFTIFADYALHAAEPRKLYLGRRIATGARNAIVEYSLKKRRYIDTTSMDAELALLTANMTHAGPGKLIYDPFVGTGSLTIAAAHFGAVAWGSDIDGRSVRGKGGVGLESGFGQYGLRGRSLGSFVADLTHGPIRGSSGGLFDGIVCDPPYGVREGLKVLGSRDGVGKEVVWIDGVAAHLYDQWCRKRIMPLLTCTVETNTFLPSVPTASRLCSVISSASRQTTLWKAGGSRCGCQLPMTKTRISTFHLIRLLSSSVSVFSHSASVRTPGFHAPYLDSALLGRSADTSTSRVSPASYILHEG